MRFRKESKVEVLRNREVPWGEWHCARIISGNGHTYSVQYDFSSMTSEANVERVPRKAIRPCPPVVKDDDSWEANDVVEVYEFGCWKSAIVLKFLGGGFYLARLLGSCKELKVHKINTRVRQSWLDDQWVMMRKGSGNSGIGKCSTHSISNSFKMTHEVKQAGTDTSQQVRNDCLPEMDGGGFPESHLASSTTLKRVSPYCSSPIEAYPRKLRAVMNEGKCQRLKAVSKAPFLEKVDHVDENWMHTSSNNGAGQYYEMKKMNPVFATKQFLERAEEHADSCSVVSSVGSCSVLISKPNEFFDDILAGPCQDADTLCSDADSLDVGDADNRCPLSPGEDDVARIHRLKLDAYRSTLETMYASGPLSWEHEAVLTNLRISLHISNDEHLMEIKNLMHDGQPF